MLKTKQLIETYHSYCIILILCLWVATFFLSWDTQWGGVAVYPFILRNIFPVLGASLIVLAVILKKLSVFILGVGVIFAFWINLFVIFAIFPLIIGN
ncbi:hypothetical protein ABID29_001434 [Streptococcus rupicaprae]|uniref:SpeK n=1 Tax=Streptococcus rupicaprae TaxID=759619 RepID=A0ABV2FIF5_9STRE